MKAKTLLVALAISGAMITCGQSQPAIQSQQAFGGSAGEFLTAIRQTTDGGYILGGYSISGVTGDKTTEPFGGYDYWLVKLDGNRVKQWDRSFGSTNSDLLWNLQQTSDGGYILAGETPSTASGSKSHPGYGAGDWWIVKVSSTGALQWEKPFGGSANETEVHALQQTTDGGYIVGGRSDSPPSGIKTSPNFGYSDYWVLKLDAAGTAQWDKTFGGNGGEGLASVRQTSDGGYVLAGSSISGVSGNKTTAGYGNGDYWLVKIDHRGNKQWESCFGGTGHEVLTSAQPTREGGYTLGGYSNSDVSGNKTSPGFGNYDYWVVKVDPSGTREWDRSFGGDANDQLNSLLQTSDGCYLLGGQSPSGVSGNKASESFGNTDGWVLKIDGQGTTEWEQAFGGTANDVVSALEEARDGSFVLGGYSNSGVSGNKTTDTLGAFDYWVINLEAPLRFSSSSIGYDRVFRAQASGTSGSRYVFQASTNLTDWSSLLTNSAADGIINFADTNSASFRMRFYRIREQP